MSQLIKCADHAAARVVVDAPLIDPVGRAGSICLAPITELGETRFTGVGIQLLAYGVGECEPSVPPEQTQRGVSKWQPVRIRAVVVEAFQCEQFTACASHPAFGGEIHWPRRGIDGETHVRLQEEARSRRGTAGPATRFAREIAPLVVLEFGFLQATVRLPLEVLHASAPRFRYQDRGAIRCVLGRDHGPLDRLALEGAILKRSAVAPKYFGARRTAGQCRQVIQREGGRFLASASQVRADRDARVAVVARSLDGFDPAEPDKLAPLGIEVSVVVADFRYQRRSGGDIRLDVAVHDRHRKRQRCRPWHAVLAVAHEVIRRIAVLDLREAADSVVDLREQIGLGALIELDVAHRATAAHRLAQAEQQARRAVAEEIAESHRVRIGNGKILDDERCRKAVSATIHPDEDPASIEIHHIGTAVAIEVCKKAALGPIAIRIWTRHGHELTLIPAQLAERRPVFDGTFVEAHPSPSVRLRSGLQCARADRGSPRLEIVHLPHGAGWRAVCRSSRGSGRVEIQ